MAFPIIIGVQEVTTDFSNPSGITRSKWAGTCVSGTEVRELLTCQHTLAQAYLPLWICTVRLTQGYVEHKVVNFTNVCTHGKDLSDSSLFI